MAPIKPIVWLLLGLVLPVSAAGGPWPDPAVGDYHWVGATQPTEEEWKATLVAMKSGAPTIGESLAVVSFDFLCTFARIQCAPSTPLDQLSSIFGNLSVAQPVAKLYLRMMIEKNDEEAAILLRRSEAIQHRKEVGVVVVRGSSTLRTRYFYGEETETRRTAFQPELTRAQETARTMAGEPTVTLYHTHPSVELYEGKGKFRLLPLSEADIQLASKLSKTQPGIPFTIKAVVLGDHSYSLTFVDGEVVTKDAGNGI